MFRSGTEKRKRKRETCPDANFTDLTDLTNFTDLTKNTETDKMDLKKYLKGPSGNCVPVSPLKTRKTHRETRILTQKAVKNRLLEQILKF